MSPADQADSTRRSLYFFHSNNDRNLFLTTFDDASVKECYRRDQSIVPQQALALTNSRLVHDAARPIAKRLSQPPALGNAAAGRSRVRRTSVLRAARRFVQMTTKSRASIDGPDGVAKAARRCERCDGRPRPGVPCLGSAQPQRFRHRSLMRVFGDPAYESLPRSRRFSRVIRSPSISGRHGHGLRRPGLGAMLQRDGYRKRSPLVAADGQPHFAPKAKSVIWLFMNGGVSHMESFDPKPMLTKYAGKTIAETPFADAQDPKKLAIERLVVHDANGQQRNNALSAAGRLPEVRRKRHRGQRLVPAHRPQRGSTGRRPLDVDHRRQPRRPDAVPLRPAHARRRVSDARRLGALRPGLAQRQPAAVHLDRQRASTGTSGTATTSAPRTTRCRCAIDPKNPLDFGQPEATFPPQAQAVGFDLFDELNPLRGDRVPERSGACGAHRVVRAGLPHAEVGARGRWTSRTRRTRRRRLYGLDQPHAASSACSSWRRGGWSSAACGSSRSSTAAAAPAPGMPTRT